jgi:hypothetical protein
MDNHYHLVIETKNANLAQVMHYLNTSYTVYFNVKRKRSGHLFQGRYKAILVEADEYLHQLSKYIHLNPVRIGIVKDPADYPHSSYKYFISNTNPPDWLNTDFMLSMFDQNIKKAKSLYKKFVLESAGNEMDLIKKNIKFGFLLGSQEFLENIKARFIEGRKDKEIPLLKAAQTQLKPDEIKQAVIKKINNTKLSRRISIYLIRKHTPLSLKEIAALFDNISDAGVSVLYNRVGKKRNIDRGLNKKITEVEKLLKVET